MSYSNCYWKPKFPVTVEIHVEKKQIKKTTRENQREKQKRGNKRYIVDNNKQAYQSDNDLQ